MSTASQGDKCGEESTAEEGAVEGTELKHCGRGALRESEKERSERRRRARRVGSGARRRQWPSEAGRSVRGG